MCEGLEVVAVALAVAVAAGVIGTLEDVGGCTCPLLTVKCEDVVEGGEEQVLPPRLLPPEELEADECVSQLLLGVVAIALALVSADADADCAGAECGACASRLRTNAREKTFEPSIGESETKPQFSEKWAASCASAWTLHEREVY